MCGWVAAVRCTRQHLKSAKDQTDHSIPHQDRAGLVRFSDWGGRAGKVATEIQFRHFAKRISAAVITHLTYTQLGFL